MYKLIKIELTRAIKNKMFLLAVILGSIISVIHFINHGLFSYKSNYILLDKDIYPLSSFQQWIGSTPNSVETYLYFLIAPILSALPFADSYFIDKQSGYIKNIYIRTNKRDYFLAKYVATFISGGLAAVIPLLLNFYLTILFIPSVVPDYYISLS